MNSTIAFYELNAAEISRHYETVDFGRFVRDAVAAAGLKPGARILDIGCGSGRDAALLLSLGCDVSGIDGSEGMIGEAERIHPELAGKLFRVVLPGRFPFPDHAFDAAFSWATLMHLEIADIGRVFGEINRILKPGGAFAYSVSTARPGLDARGEDERGRHFTSMPSHEWERLHTAAGFVTNRVEESDDISGRPGFHWIAFTALKRQP